MQVIPTGWKKNLEFDNLGKKKLEKPGILYKSHGKTWNFIHKSWYNHKTWNLF